MINYISRHFNGELTMTKSFFVNLCLIGFLLFGVVLQALSKAKNIELLVIFYPIYFCVIFWGIVGSWRAGTNATILYATTSTAVIYLVSAMKLILAIWFLSLIGSILDYQKILELYASSK